MIRQGYDLHAIRKNQHCQDVHICKVFVRNGTRQKGVYDEHEKPDQNAINGFKKMNQRIREWYSEIGEIGQRDVRLAHLVQ